MNLRRLTFEHVLFILALILALGVRLLNLGAVPLADSEASYAIQALEVAGRSPAAGSPEWGPQPAYIFLTGVTFTILGSSNFLARFWPALAGGILVLLPFLFRNVLGRKAALILAIGLALDPGLVSVSRLAGGPMMALAFSLLAVGFWLLHRRILAGVFAGLALLSGPAVITGALGLALAWGITRLAERSQEEKAEWGSDGTLSPNVHPPTSEAQRPVLLSAAAVVLLFGTLFMRYPQGLAAWAGTLPAYFMGWANPSGTPALRLLAALVFLEPLAFIFGLIGAVHLRIKQEINVFPETQISPMKGARLFLTLFALISLLLVLIYPGRQVADLVWVLAPLWALAALELSQHLPDTRGNIVSLGQAVLIFLLMALFWYTLAALDRAVPGIAASGVRLAVLLGNIALGVLTTALVSLGWSWSAGRRGLIWGITAGLAVYSLSAMWSAAYIRPNQPQELWGPSPTIDMQQASLFLNTLENLSEQHSGLRRTIDLVVSVEAPSLQWIVRDFPKAVFVSQPALGELPSALITRQEQAAPALTASYRGQDFVWWVKPGWNEALPPNLTSWLTFREAPLQQEQIILWARSDLFPGGSVSPVDSPAIQP